MNIIYYKQNTQFIRFIKINIIKGREKYINNEILKIGHREKSKPYDSKIFVHQMQMKFKDEWLNQLEEQWRSIDDKIKPHYDNLNKE